MDGRRFDALARAVMARGSRRRLLTRLLAGTGLVAGLGSGRFVAPTAAQEDDRKCRGKPAIDNDHCPEASICRLRDNQVCACTRTVGGAKKCVDITDETCPTEDECDSSDDCRGDQLCIELGGCCEGSPRNLCVRPCSVSTTTEASTAGSPVRAPLLGRP
jgi:hypothetical protein